MGTHSIPMEDRNYRSSSQFRLWTFTPESLSEIRRTTNQAAQTQVRAAIQRARQKKRQAKLEGGSATSEADDKEKDGSTGGDAGEEKEIECLTPEEEVKIVRYYCRKIMEIAQVFDFPTNVKASAATFLRRFFTRTSPMTYHPKTLLCTILYLTTKTENHYISLSSFSAKIPKSTPAEILAPEFVVAMGLGWCFDVKHPFRALIGAIMELNKVCDGKYHPPALLVEKIGDADAPPLPTAAEWKAKLHALPSPPSGAATPKQRIDRAHGKARAILMLPALLTDAYFLFTPPQIYLAALYIVDSPLALFFIDLKHPAPVQADAKAKLIATVQSCAEEIRKGGDPSAPISKEELDEATRIDRKLYFCRNPEKVDLMSLNKMAKRGVVKEEEGSATGDTDENERRQREVKKRKLEREKNQIEGEELFGKSLKK